MNPPAVESIRTIGSAVVVTLLLLTSACSSDEPARGGAPDRSTTTEEAPSTTAPAASGGGEDLAPEASAEAAVSRLLELLQQGDAAASYRLLDEAGRRSFATVEAWERRLAGSAAITSFEIEGSEGAQVVALVSHDPVLDPFQGLVPARERQTWTAVEVDGGWLVGPQPATEYLLPPDARAASAASDWVRAVQACEEDAPRAQQAVDILFNASTEYPSVCGISGPVEAGAVQTLDAGPGSADLVAQYSSDVLSWARVVPISIGDLHLAVIMAPIGDSWEVLGVSD